MKETNSFKDIESESRVKRVESDCGGPWQCGCFAGKRQRSPSIGLNVKTGARRNLGQEWTSPVIGNSVYGPASPSTTA